MKTRIDWSRIAWNSLHATRHATGHLLIWMGKLMVGVGFHVHHLGKRLAPYSRSQE